MGSERSLKSFLKKHQIVLISVALSLFSLHIALTSKKQVERGYIVREFLSALASPVQTAVLGAYNGAVDAYEGYIDLTNVKAENEVLASELLRLADENNRLREELLLGERLKALLDYRERAPFKTTAAGVVAFNIERWTRTVVIDKGEDDGIGKDMAVITPEGVVGRVVEVNGHTSRVMLNTDLRSNIDVMIQRTRTKGVAEGNGSGLMLKYILELDDVQIGDKIITSGVSGIFPKGLLVGEVVKIEKSRDNFFRHIEVAPAVDTKRLEEVLVISVAPAPGK